MISSALFVNEANVYLGSRIKVYWQNKTITKHAAYTKAKGFMPVSIADTSYRSSVLVMVKYLSHNQI